MLLPQRVITLIYAIVVLMDVIGTVAPFGVDVLTSVVDAVVCVNGKVGVDIDGRKAKIKF
jgi:hypothetical protein